MEKRLGEIHKMNINYYNNFGIGVVAIAAVLNHSKELAISKLFLIFPISSHQKLLQHLGRKTTKIRNIEKLIAEQISYFSNFNKRYVDSLVLTLNSIQYLNDTGYIDIVEGKVISSKLFEHHTMMGNRAKRIFNASENISILLQESSSKLYLNLRVEL